MTQPSASQRDSRYDQIRRTWRFQDELTKRSMVGELKLMRTDDLEKSLALDVLALADEIETELRLEEIQDTE